MLLGIDPFAMLTVVDYGDAECMPADIARSHAEVARRVGEILTAGAIPIVLGGDHSVAYPNLTAIGRHFGPGEVGVIQFDAHADTAEVLWGVRLSHGTPMRLAVDDGSILGKDVIQIGLRGYWPLPHEWQWMREQGFRWHSMHEIDDNGFPSVLETVLEEVRDVPLRIYLIVDIDCLDPAFAPGTGTPEPGGLTVRELLSAVRRICSQLPIVDMEVVEVSPPFDPSGVTALAAHRCILEALSGIALRRSGREATPERPAERPPCPH